jgi:hypothetical protein
MYSIIGKYIRNKALGKYTPNSDVSYKNLKEVSLVGFTYNVDSQQSAQEFINIVEQLNLLGIPYKGVVVAKKTALLLAAISSEGLGDGYLKNVIVLDSSMLTLFKEPKPGVLDEFYSNKFDIFINFNSMDCITLDVIVLNSNFNYLIGMKNSSLIPNNMVLMGSNGTILSNIDFLKQIIHYLSTIQCAAIQDYNE